MRYCLQIKPAPLGGLEEKEVMLQRPEPTDAPHVAATFEARKGVFELRSKLHDMAHNHPGLREELAPVIGSLTCCMTALYDTIERLRRTSATQQNQTQG